MPAATTSTTCSLWMRAPTLASCSKRWRELRLRDELRVHQLERALLARAELLDDVDAPMPPAERARTIRKSPAKVAPGARLGKLGADMESGTE